MNDYYEWHDIPRDHGMRERFGMSWDDQELAQLKRYFEVMRYNGFGLLWLAEKTERPVNGIVPKLEKAGLIERSGNQWRIAAPKFVDFGGASLSDLHMASSANLLSGDFVMYGNANTISFNQEKPVTHPNIETKTFINGRDAAALSDAEIFTQIAKLEDEARTLSEIQTPSEKLKARVTQLQADAVALAKYVDERAPA